MGRFDDPDLTNPLLDGLADSLVEQLVPLRDAVLDIGVQLGTRQYVVSLVWATYSLGQRNYGPPTVFAAHVLTPVPKVVPEVIQSPILQVGHVETGNMILTEVSPRYSDKFLRGLELADVDVAQPLPKEYDFWYEIVLVHAADAAPVTRRFTLIGPPQRDVDGMQWKIGLQRSEAGGRALPYAT